MAHQLSCNDEHPYRTTDKYYRCFVLGACGWRISIPLPPVPVSSPWPASAAELPPLHGNCRRSGTGKATGSSPPAVRTGSIPLSSTVPLPGQTGTRQFPENRALFHTDPPSSAARDLPGRCRTSGRGPPLCRRSPGKADRLCFHSLYPGWRWELPSASAAAHTAAAL